MMGSRAGIALATMLMIAGRARSPARGQRAVPDRRPAEAPETIPVSVNGTARDEDGKPIAGARVFLVSTGPSGPRLAAQAKTNGLGRYRIEGGQVDVVREDPGGAPLPAEVTPYADFVVCGTAPGLGVAWVRPQSMDALAERNPDDIQGRLPLGRPVVQNLDFYRAAALSGRVVDEGGRPIAGARVRVRSADLLDEAGRETNNTLDDAWIALPDAIGSAATDASGRFAIGGLPDRACFLISVRRPDAESTRLSLYAATIDGADTVHRERSPGTFHGRPPHPVKAGDVAIAFPAVRRIAVSLVAGDTNRPVAGVRVTTHTGDEPEGITSSGTTDRDGKVFLGLPPGKYPGIDADPPFDTHYLRTSRRPLVVEPGDGDQPCRLVLNAGCDLRIRVTEAGTSRPVAGVYFWRYPVDGGGDPEEILRPGSRSGPFRTDASGIARAVLAPEPGRQYRVVVGGIHLPSMPDASPIERIGPAGAMELRIGPRGLGTDPRESRPIELAAGKTIRLWFVVVRRPGRPDRP